MLLYDGVQDGYYNKETVGMQARSESQPHFKGNLLASAFLVSISVFLNYLAGREASWPLPV